MENFKNVYSKWLLCLVVFFVFRAVRRVFRDHVVMVPLNMSLSCCGASKTRFGIGPMASCLRYRLSPLGTTLISVAEN